MYCICKPSVTTSDTRQILVITFLLTVLDILYPISKLGIVTREVHTGILYHCFTNQKFLASRATWTIVSLTSCQGVSFEPTTSSKDLRMNLSEMIHRKIFTFTTVRLYSSSTITYL